MIILKVSEMWGCTGNGSLVMYILCIYISLVLELTIDCYILSHMCHSYRWSLITHVTIFPCYVSS